MTTWVSTLLIVWFIPNQPTGSSWISGKYTNSTTRIWWRTLFVDVFYQLLFSASRWLFVCLIDWLIGLLIDWLNVWLTDKLINWLIDWLVDWLIDWLIDWWNLLIRILYCQHFAGPRKTLFHLHKRLVSRDQRTLIIYHHALSCVTNTPERPVIAIFYSYSYPKRNAYLISTPKWQNYFVSTVPRNVRERQLDTTSAMWYRNVLDSGRWISLRTIIFLDQIKGDMKIQNNFAPDFAFKSPIVHGQY